MNLSAWLQYLEQLHPVSIELGLDRIRKVAERLQLNLESSRIITIAGTNGKGSTAALLEALLIKADHSVGLYRSPHLQHYNERLQINGRMASDESLCIAFEKIEVARAEISLSYFEFGTLAAFLLFAEQDLEYLLLEVGLGGRLDAVNLLDADLAIITNIALDHTDWLGDTRELIGQEKAGIMRLGRPVLFGDRDMPESVRQHAESLNAPLYQFGQDYVAQLQAGNWHWQGQDRAGQALACTLVPGDCALLELFPANAATALQAFFLLDLSLAENEIASAWQELHMPGRFQRMDRGRYTLVLDVAHNPHAMQLTASLLQAHFTGRKVRVLLGMLNDKDHRQVIEILAPHIEEWYVCSLSNSRGTPAKILYNALQASGPKTSAAYDSVREAFTAAEESLEPGDVLLVTGSFYTVAAVLELI